MHLTGDGREVKGDGRHARARHAVDRAAVAVDAHVGGARAGRVERPDVPRVVLRCVADAAARAVAVLILHG